MNIRIHFAQNNISNANLNKIKKIKATLKTKTNHFLL